MYWILLLVALSPIHFHLPLNKDEAFGIFQDSTILYCNHIGIIHTNPSLPCRLIPSRLRLTTSAFSSRVKLSKTSFHQCWACGTTSKTTTKMLLVEPTSTGSSNSRWKTTQPLLPSLSETTWMTISVTCMHRWPIGVWPSARLTNMDRSSRTPAPAVMVNAAYAWNCTVTCHISATRTNMILVTYFGTVTPNKIAHQMCCMFSGRRMVIHLVLCNLTRVSMSLPIGALANCVLPCN